MKNKLLKKAAALVLSTLLILSSFPMTALAAEAQLVQNNDTYSVNMPVTDTDTLDLTDKDSGFTFHVYDNGGADANYSNYCDGTLLITAPENYIFRISGSGESENNCDWLYIYDGDTTTELGSGKYTGTYTVDEVTSSGNVLKLFFHSDGGVTYSGVDLTITLVDSATLATISFISGEGSGTMNNIVVEPGTEVTLPECGFTAPSGKLFFGYTDGTNSYKPGDVITLSENKALTATFTDKLTVTYAYGDQTHSVDVVTGTEITLPTFTSLFTQPDRKTFQYWLSGETQCEQGSTFTVTADTTFTAFLTDDPVILHGEAGTVHANYENYALIPKTTSVTADLTDESEGYLLWVFDNGGVAGNYANNCNGSITVLAPAGCIMQVTSDVNTELNCDYLYVYDGDSTSAELLGSFSGSNGTGKLYSTGAAVTIRFTSDGSYNRRGIDMKITVTRPETLVRVSFDPGEGSGTMDDIVLLPGDQIYMPYNAFTVPEGYLFNYYSDGTKTYKEHDYITVTENIHLTAIYVEKITITYQYGEATNVFTYKKGAEYSVRSFNAVGFTLPYRKSFKCWLNGETEVNASVWLYATEDITYTPVLTDLPYLIEDDDGGWYATLPKDEHVTLDLSDKENGFTFMLYDDGGKDNWYSLSCDGSMTLTAPEGCVLAFSGSIKAQSGTDYLVIYDSDMTTPLGQESFSADSLTELPKLYSTGRSAKVYFFSDDYYNTTGFELTVTVLDPDTLITVSFDAGEGSGEMDELTQIAGVAFTLPDYGFTAPSGKIFNGYSDGTTTYWPNSSVTFNANTTLTAQWVESTGITYSYRNNTQAVTYARGSAVTLPAFTDMFTLPSGMHFVGWQEKFSGDMYNEGDSYVANDPTVMTAVLEILYSDGNGGYYTLMPINNPYENLTLDLSDKQSGFSFTLYDDGGSNGNYRDSNDGALIVKAPENMVVSVIGSGQTELNYDYLTFYDGASSSDPVIGDSKYSGNLDFTEPVVSTGNYMQIYFHSDSSYNYAGFALTVSVIAQNQITYVFDDETQNVAVQKDSTIQLAYFDDLFTSYTKEFLYWQIGDDTYDEGDEYYVSEDVTVTAVTRLMPTATIDGNGATVKEAIGGDGTITTIGPLPYPTGTTVPLPHANEVFDFPENKYFGGWSCNGSVYAAGDEFTITENVTLTAIWRDAAAWEQLNDQLQTASGTITLTDDITAEIGSLPLSVPAGVTVTVDLNGFTLDGTNAAMIDGNIICVNGNLTITDSSENGAIAGGGITAIESGVFTPSDHVGAQFAAAVTMSYVIEDNETDEQTDGIYSVSYYPTLAQAMTAAESEHNYKNNISTLPEDPNSYYFWYNDSKVALLKDVTIGQSETVTVNSDESIWLDLNGHTFDNQGTFTGGTWGRRYSNGEYIDTFYPTNIQIVSENTTGVFRSNGNIGVSLCPWTEDTYYFTGGTVSGFLGADGGSFHISGGHFTDLVMFNNGNEDASLEIDLSGDAEFDRLEHMIYSDDDASAIHMTISDNVRIGAMLFAIMGDGVVNYPVLTVNGGYFTASPSTWRDADGAGENAVEILYEPEQYTDQTDWAADSSVYTWRVNTPTIPVFAGHSLILGSDIGVNFYTQLDDSTLSDEGAYMLFTLPNGTTQKIYVKDAVTNDNRTDDTVVWTENIGGTTYYIFKCDVAAKEMTSEIKAQIISSDNKCVGQMTYTIKEYADYILNNDYDEKTKNLVRAMLNYGASAQALFGFNTNTPANADMTNEEKTVTPFTEEEIESLDKAGVQTASSIDGIEGVTYEGSQFVLLSKTTYRLRFSKGLDNYTVTVNGKAAEPTVSGEYRIITIDNISPDKLFEDIALTFTPKNSPEGTAGKTVKFNPSSYVRLAAALTTTGVSDEESQANLNLIATMTALYRLTRAAIAYLG